MGVVHRMSRRSIGSSRPAFVAAALCIVALEACGSSRPAEVPAARASTPGVQSAGVLYVPAVQPFAVSLVPAVPVPIRLGDRLGFSVSSGTAGYYSLYLIDPASEVWVLGENMPLGAGSVTYPSPPAQNFTLTAAEPLGRNRVIVLVTRDPVSGFSGDDTLTSAVSLAIRGDTFVERLNRTTRSLPSSDWAIDEITVSVVA